MKCIIIYLILFISLLVLMVVSPNFLIVPSWYVKKILFANCAYMGGIGGVLYCLRAIYLNKCVFQRWDENWCVWYYLRPIVSVISGLISCIFLKAGLLVLDAKADPYSVVYGYLAISFIAGYNVDNFMKKIETIAHTVWGISKSRASEQINKNEETL